MLLDLTRSFDLPRSFDIDLLCSSPKKGDLPRFFDSDRPRSSFDLDLLRLLCTDLVRFLDDDRPRFPKIDCVDGDLWGSLDNESTRSLDFSTSLDLDFERFLDLDLARSFDRPGDCDITLRLRDPLDRSYLLVRPSGRLL